jgi:hypothetical protein
MVVATCVLAGALGAGAVAAAGVQPGDAQHRTAGIARAAERGITGELVGALTKAIRAAGGK